MHREIKKLKANSKLRFLISKLNLFYYAEKI